MRPSLYEFAGGDEAFLRLATAHHARCLADPELNHPFSHPGQNPKHVERLAAYWAEVMGGPPTYSKDYEGHESSLIIMHAGMGDMSDLGRRFVDCFVKAADDAGLPDDKEFRQALRAYMEWAVGDVALSHPHDTDVPNALPIPHWSWEGPVTGLTRLPADTVADRDAGMPQPLQETHFPERSHVSQSHRHCYRTKKKGKSHIASWP